MPIDPGTAILVAAAIATAMQGGMAGYGSAQQAKLGRRRAAEADKSREAQMLQSQLDRGAEEDIFNLGQRQKMGKRGRQSLQDTAANFRGGLNI